MKKIISYSIFLFIFFFLALILFVIFSDIKPYQVVFNSNFEINHNNDQNYEIIVKLDGNVYENLYFSEKLNKQNISVDLDKKIEVISKNQDIKIVDEKRNSKLLKEFKIFYNENAIGVLLLVDSDVPVFNISFKNNLVINPQSNYQFITSTVYKTKRSFKESVSFVKNRTLSLPYLFQTEIGIKNKLFVLNQYLMSLIKMINGTIAYHDGYIFIHDINGYPKAILKTMSSSQLFYSQDTEEYALLVNPSLELPRKQVLLLDKNFNFLDKVQIVPDYKSTDGHFVYMDKNIIRIDGYRDNGESISYVIQEFSRSNLIHPLWEFDSTDFYDISDSYTYPKCDISINCKDYVHGNSHKIFKSKDEYLLSFRHLNSIAKYNRKQDRILWSLGNDKYSPLSPAIREENIYLNGQHDPSFTEDGTLILFDNGTFNKKNARIIELDINEDLNQFKVLNILELEDVSMSGGLVDKKDNLYFTILSDPLNINPKFQIFYQNQLQYELFIDSVKYNQQLLFSTKLVNK